MDQPLVSIILPVYNAQNHLARCIGSILNQTYKNIELIILNDGSRDHSLPVCEEFRARDSRIVLVDKENSGVSDTRNLGLKLAGGEYVQFVDSDDYIDPDFTQHLVEAAEAHHADLVIAPYKMVIPAGATKPEQVLEKLEDNLGVMSVARPPEVREYGFLPAGVYDKDTFALRLMDKPASYFYSVLWNKLYRREIIAQNQLGFAPDVHWAEDLIFNMGYLEHAQVFVSIPEAGYHYIQNPKSLCHTQIDLRGILQNDQPRGRFLFQTCKQQIQNGFFAGFGVEDFIDLAAGKKDDLHRIFSCGVILDLLHKVCQDGHRCFQTTVAVFRQLRCQGIEAVHKEQAFLLAEIGQKVFELFVFLWVQT